MTNRTLVGLVTATLALGMCSAVAIAADRKNYPGAFCTSSDGNGLYYNRTGAVENREPSLLTTICPVHRDDTRSSMFISDWDVVVSRPSTGPAWDLFLHSRNTSGTAGYSGYITVGAGNGDQVKDGGQVSSYSDGVVYIQTELPVGATIRGYRVSEE